MLITMSIYVLLNLSQAYCPQKELPKLYAKESALDSYQEKDIVRGNDFPLSPVVIKVFKIQYIQSLIGII